MATEQEVSNKNKQWFDTYVERLRNFQQLEHKKFIEFYFCPCCNYPTLSERGIFEICPLCFWEDDGQDDPYADKVLGGPNSDYSLSEARENFKKFYTMYRPNDSYHFRRTTTGKTILKDIQINKIDLKKTILQKYEELYDLVDIIQIQQLIKEIHTLEKKL